MKFYEAFDHLIQSSIPPYIYLFAHDGQLNLFKNKVKRSINMDIKGFAFKKQEISKIIHAFVLSYK